jgi:hypothetical protein
MLLSRFWYGFLALALGVATFILFVAAQMYNRAGSRSMSDSLSADSSAVDWFLRDDARKRSSALIPFTLSSDIGAALSKASGDAKIDRDTRSKTKSALHKLAEEVPADLKFDALWAVDAEGRVIASEGFEHTEDWELGGYSSVADALHGWIRDDAWVWRGRIYRVVTRPVEKEAGSEPVGAIVGAKIVDDVFTRAVSKRTGAAVGFYADGARVASGSPEGFDKANLDEITRDLKLLDTNKDYQEKGRSEVRVIREGLGVVYARLPGDAWDLGAGYAVGRLRVSISNPFDFLNQADNTDKEKVPTKFIILGILVVGGLGLFFSVLEHTRPITNFRSEVSRLAKGEIDVFQPSRFRGTFKKIASDLNDGIEKVAAKGGAPRKAADLEQVLGPIPAQPQMSAFSVPGPGMPGQDPLSASRPAFKPPPVSDRGGAARLRQTGSGSMPAVVPPPEDTGESIDVRTSVMMEPPRAGPPRPPSPPGRPMPPVPPRRPGAPAEALNVAEASTISHLPADPTGDYNEIEDWRRVYEEFIAVKKQCGEPTGPLTFEKFRGTLQRNKDALVARHNCARVRFTVYIKEGKAALKASPVK